MRKDLNFAIALFAAGMLVSASPMAFAQTSSTSDQGDQSSTQRKPTTSTSSTTTTEESGKTGQMESTTGTGQSTSSEQTGQSSTRAQGQDASTQAGSGTLSSTDRRFMTKAAQGSMAEIELGKLASEKASSEKVKEFAKRMVDDHSKASDRLKEIASNKGVDLPSDLSSKDQSMKSKLENLSGEEFDRAYMKHMSADHKRDVSEFRRASTAAKDNDVKSFASETLPTLEEHSKMAQDVYASVRGTGGRTGTAADASSRTDTSGADASSRTGTSTGTSTSETGTSTGTSDRDKDKDKEKKY